MTIKVTIHLKSGGNVTTEVTGKPMEEMKTTYLNGIKNGDGIVHEEANGDSIQIIPIDNIACVDLREVAECTVINQKINLKEC